MIHKGDWKFYVTFDVVLRGRKKMLVCMANEQLRIKTVKIHILSHCRFADDIAQC